MIYVRVRLGSINLTLQVKERYNSTAMGRVSIPCDRCGNDIEYPDDLMVSALWGLIPKKYHRVCYAEREKEVVYQIFYQTYPVNFGMGNLVAVLSPLLAVGLAWWVWKETHLFALVILLVLVGIWPLVLRLFVYWRWERPLISSFSIR